MHGLEVHQSPLITDTWLAAAKAKIAGFFRCLRTLNGTLQGTHQKGARCLKNLGSDRSRMEVSGSCDYGLFAFIIASTQNYVKQLPNTSKKNTHAIVFYIRFGVQVIMCIRTTARRAPSAYECVVDQRLALDSQAHLVHHPIDDGRTHRLAEMKTNLDSATPFPTIDYRSHHVCRFLV